MLLERVVEKSGRTDCNPSSCRINSAFCALGAAARLAVLALSLLGGVKTQSATLVHDFYLPMPEVQIRSSFLAVQSSVGTTMDTTFSIVVTGEGTRIHYDHWEDGYELDLNSPTQSSTQIWGDGNNANGVPPGYVNDPVGLPAGSVIFLRNLVTLPRNPATVLYDGRDRMAGTKALVVSRTCWATSPGSVLAGASEVQGTIDYGTSFICPIGQDANAFNMFDVVGVFVMAEQDGTVVTIDTDGPGPTASFDTLLNQGESYVVTSGIKKGATITATKPVQAHLATGRIAGNYEVDWFTLYPVDQWYSSYITPVGTAPNGNETYVFLYNPQTTNIVVNYTNRVGNGSLTIPANGVVSNLPPVNSGSIYTSVGGVNFFAIVRVGARPTANNVYDWGFTLLPLDGLTTEAVVGWGPGSSDGSANGSPVWVAAERATTIYVDYNGEGSGAFTDPNGRPYDIAISVAALESRRIYDSADRDQTGMRLWTADGTLFTAAWGEDPSVAAAGNPFLDVGTTVLPFPVPFLNKASIIVTNIGPTTLSGGDTLEYSISLDNKGLLPLGNTVIIDIPATNVTYISNSTKLNGSPIPDNVTGTPFPLDGPEGYTIPLILRGGTSTFTYRFLVNSNATGIVSNSVNGVNQTANSVLSASSTNCNVAFTDAGGTPASSYAAGAGIYVTVTDNDLNLSLTATNTITITVRNTSNNDTETITLVETGTNTGVFRNSSPLPTSLSLGLVQQDGTLNVAPGDGLSVNYTDPIYGDTCNATAIIQTPSQGKVLYLTPGSSNYVSASSATLAAAATSTGNSANTSSLSFSHTPGTGTNRLMLVGIAVGATTSGGNPPTVTGVTFGGTGMTLVTNQVSGVGGANDDVIVYIYRLTNPASGAANVVVSLSGAGSIAAGATTFTNVDQTTPLGTPAVNSSTGSGSASVTNSSAGGEIVYSIVGWDENPTITVAGGQTSLWNITPGAAPLTGAASTKPGAASVVSSYSSDNTQDWGLAAVSVRPALIISTNSSTGLLDRIDPVTTGDSTTTNAAFSSSSPLVVESVSTNALWENTLGAPLTTQTISHTTSTNANRLMLVTIASENDNGGILDVTAVSYGGQALTKGAEQGTTEEATVEVWYLVNPPSGTTNVVVSYSGGTQDADSVFTGVMTFSGVNTNTPFGTWAQNSGYSTGGSLNVTSAQGELVFGAAALDDARGITNFAGAGQIEWYNGRSESGVGDGVSASALTRAGSNTVTLVWTNGYDAWATIGVSIKPANPTATPLTFQQTPNFCSSFLMPAGGVVGVTSYVSVVSGTMPTNPAVSATLQYNGTNIITLTSPTYSASSNWLVWSGALGSSVTLPDGSAITAVFSNAQAGVNFLLEYDSQTKPSRITLPTTSVIDITSMAVYDDPYPGGSLVTAAANGSVLYVRLTVTDPFGAYDINNVNLVIDGPGASGDLTNTLTDAYLVSSNSCSKTYEYVWYTGVTQGSYTLTAVANEGTEGAITDTASTGVTLSFQDVGTPCNTEFTSGNNGTATNQYATNATIWVRVTDLDQNLTNTLVETLSVTISSSVNGTNDLETVVLTETGTNTGVFTGSIPSSSTTYSGTNSGTLYAPVTTVLTLNYTDPTDATDPCSAIATVPPTPGTPSLSVTKTLVLPADGQATLGEAVQYQLQVINNGSTNLNPVTVFDNFPSNKLAYISASPTPDIVGGQTLTWSNVGPLSAGQSTLLTVTFAASNTAAPAINTVIASNALITPNPSNSAPVTITRIGIALEKTLIDPLSGPVPVGSNITYRIAITNTGATAITNLPLEDTFSAACYQYVTSSVPPDATGAGSLLWFNLIGTNVMATNAFTNITVTLKAIGGCAPANNIAKVEYGLDIFGDPLPPVSDTAGIDITAAKISGFVYDDKDVSGTLTGGDVGLAGVTVRLFTDPNGDGDPADGVLVKVTTTAANGAYEFLGLNTNNYVVVETDLLGYSSSGDTGGANDNRIPVVLSTLTTNSGNNFFDYAVSPTNYSTIYGAVYHDSNANGTNNAGETTLSNVVVELISDLNSNGVADFGEPVYLSTTTTTNRMITNYFSTNVVLATDNFQSGNYTGGSGWLTNWGEFNDNNNDASGQVRVSTDPLGSTVLEIRRNPFGAQRAVNLSGLTNVTLSYDYRSPNTEGGTDQMWIQVSTNGVNYNTIYTNVLVTNTSYTSVSLDLSAFISTNTWIRFVATNGFDASGGGDQDFVYVDNVQISYTSNYFTTNLVNYSFSSIPPGAYVIRETDPPGYYSTGDAVGTNDNLIPVTLPTGGTNIAGLDFFDNNIQTINGKVYKDENSNGTFDPGTDTPLQYVAVRIVNSLGVITTNYTDANGNWTNTVPSGSTTVTVLTADPNTNSVTQQGLTNYFPTGYVQTEGSNPTTIFVSTNTNFGNDGFISAGGTASISGTVYSDTYEPGNNAFNTNDMRLPGVIVRLYLDLDNDQLADTVRVIQGMLDMNGDGVINSSDDGIIQGVPIVNGGIDLDGNGAMSAGDDGAFLGYPVIDGKFDLNDDGSVDTVGTTDNGLVVTEPLVAADITTLNGQYTMATLAGDYQFTNLAAGNYVVFEVDPPGVASENEESSQSFTGSLTNSQMGIVLTTGQSSTNNNFLDGVATLYSISGIVYEDGGAGAAGDGVIGNSGDFPLPGVTIALYRDANLDGIASESEYVVSLMTLQADGSFTFTNLPNGRYLLVEVGKPAGVTNVTDRDGNANGNNTIALSVFNGNSANNNFLLDNLSASATYALLKEFRTYATGDGLLAWWRTATEVGSVQFDLYRFTGGAAGWVRVNREPVPAANRLSGVDYQVADPGADAMRPQTYRLVEWDERGQAHSYGPFTLTALPGTPPEPVPAAEAPRKFTPARLTAASANRTAARLASLEELGVTHRVKLTTREPGLYRLEAQALAALLGLPEAELRQSLLAGQLVLVSGGKITRALPADDGSALYFYAEALRNNYTDENTYWLTRTEGAATPAADAQPPVPVEGAYYWEVLNVESNLTAQPSLTTNPEEDYWMWIRVTASRSVDTALLNANLDQVVAEPGFEARLTVRLQGGSQTPHRVVATVNGTEVGRAEWQNLDQFAPSFAVPAALLREGLNQIRLKAERPDPAQFSRWYVNGYELVYPRRCQARDGSLEFAPGGQTVVTVSGFAAPEIRALDISSPAAPVLLTNLQVELVNGSYRATLAPPNPLGRLVLWQPGAEKTPASLALVPVTDLSGATNEAACLVITSESLAAAAEVLAAHRRQQGLASKVVTVESIYNEFSQGVPSPQAIRAFLAHAFRHWRVKPTYAVLAGNGTYDYRNLQGFGDNLVPPAMIGTPEGLFPSDSVYGDINGDGIPEIAVGRLPATTPAELQAMIAKIQSYEAQPPPAFPRALLIADQPDASNFFPSDLASADGLLAGKFERQLVNAAEAPDAEAVRAAILAGLNEGADLVGYFGHGATAALGFPEYLSTADVPQMQNAVRWPVVLAATCLSGQYAVPAANCLAEAMVLREQGGAIAMVAPSGLSYNSDAGRLNLRLVQAFKANAQPRVGDLVRQAVAGYVQNEQDRTQALLYNLIGDPAALYQVERDALPANQPPSIALLNLAHTRWSAPAALVLQADAFDLDGQVQKVEFFNGGSKAGEATQYPYFVIVSGLLPGFHDFHAVATDNEGATATSAVARVTVTVENQPPWVGTPAPLFQGVPYAPANLTLDFEALDPDGYLERVEVYSGADRIAVLDADPFSLTFSNLAAGTRDFRVVATDNQGAQTWSSNVRVNVLPFQITRHALVGGQLRIEWLGGGPPFLVQRRSLLDPTAVWETVQTLGNVTNATVPMIESATIYRVRSSR